MAATSWLLCALVPAGLHILVSADQQTIQAEPGQNVSLPCRISSSNPVRVVEWSRADLGTDYVLLYRDKQIDPFNQHPSFENRVGLQEIEKGDVSLVLRDVGTEDSGTYECRVVQSETNRKKELISTVSLHVAPPPAPGRFEKLTGDQESQTGENRETGDGDGGDQMVTPEPAAGHEAEETKNAETSVSEKQPVAAAQQGQGLGQMGIAGNEDGGNTDQKNRTVPGVIASLSCVAAVIAAVIALILWKKKNRSDHSPYHKTLTVNHQV